MASITFRLTDAQRERLVSRANREGRTMANVLCRLIDRMEDDEPLAIRQQRMIRESIGTGAHPLEAVAALSAGFGPPRVKPGARLKK